MVMIDVERGWRQPKLGCLGMMVGVPDAEFEFVKWIGRTFEVTAIII